MANYPKKVARVISMALVACLFSLNATVAKESSRPGFAQNKDESHLSVKIGNYFMYAPYGISMIVNNATAFEIQPVFKGEPIWSGNPDSHNHADVAYLAPGITTPDFSYVQSTFNHDGAEVTFTWGRSGSDAVIGMLQANKPVTITLALPATTWPNFHTIYKENEDGVSGYGITAEGHYIPFHLKCDPEPAGVQANLSPGAQVILNLKPGHPAKFAAVVGNAAMPDLNQIESTLDEAHKRYETYHLTSSGSWGNFLSAIPDNMNFTRLYSSDNGRIAHIVGRGWWIGRRDPNIFPYFAWDSFFNGILANLEDPKDARNTIRAVLSFQTPSGFIPLDSHWSDSDSYVTMDRSDPPIGAMAVWKMNQRWPDRSFLAEVYPHLVKWHEWWMKERDGNHDGLLEWGSQKDFKQGAMWETGWDDNVEYARAHMVGNTLNADAVDLNSLWSMDAEYLAKIARVLGKTKDVRRFEEEHKAMNHRINKYLWNPKLGMYCSRLWSVPKEVGPDLIPQKVFKDGFKVTYYSDQILKHAVAHETEYRIRHRWQNASPARGVPQNHWSAEWTGTFSPEKSRSYRFVVSAGTGARLYLNGKEVIDTWHTSHDQERYADITVAKGQKVPVKLEYFNEQGSGFIRMTVHAVSPGKPGSEWLTRFTPMNFYPLAAGVPDAKRAKKVLSYLYKKNTFWLHWLLPTVSKEDPVWPDQGYWHGNVWPPANYLVWQGLKRYADLKHQAEFVQRSVALYMRDWKGKRLNGENYSSITGKVNGDPHYSWGALLPVIGLEEFTKINAQDKPEPRDNKYIQGHIVLKHVPFDGKRYTIVSDNGKVTITRE